MWPLNVATQSTECVAESKAQIDYIKGVLPVIYPYVCFFVFCMYVLNVWITEFLLIIKSLLCPRNHVCTSVFLTESGGD